jgi:hypothetical protein
MIGGRELKTNLEFLKPRTLARERFELGFEERRRNRRVQEGNHPTDSSFKLNISRAAVVGSHV